MNKISMKTTSLLHGDTETMTLEGVIKSNEIVFEFDGKLMLTWTDNSVTMSNGLNLELNKLCDSSIKTPMGEIAFESNMTELEVTDNSISFTYEVIISGQVEEMRKIEYRW